MSDRELIRVGIWIRLEMPDGPVIGFTYVDAEAGFSAQGWQLADAEAFDHSSHVIVRLHTVWVPWRPLDTDEIQKLRLESPPEWLEAYGPQPAAGMLWGAWRNHPLLRGRLHPEHPDDIQVCVHDGGPRFSQNAPEAVWVRVEGVEGDVFQGRVLNQPHHLTSVRLRDEIRFVVADGAEFPIQVREKYLRERGAWIIHPCQKCGLSELFDAPSDLIRVVFPNIPADAQMGMFTAFCPLCGGPQVVEAKDNPASQEEKPSPSRRPWWQFWG